MHHGMIHCFVKASNCDCGVEFCRIECNAQYSAIINKCHVVPVILDNITNSSLTHIHECTVMDDAIAVDVSNSYYVCFYVKIPSDNIFFIIIPVNLIESEW